MNFKYITTMRETLMTTTDKNNFKIKIERIRDRNIFHANKAQDLFTYGVNRPKITSIQDSAKKIIEGRMWVYFNQAKISSNVCDILSYNERAEKKNNDTMAIQVESLTYGDGGNSADLLPYREYTVAIRNHADVNVARYTDAQNTLANDLINEAENQNSNVQDSMIAAYQISSALLLNAIVEVTQFLASLIMNIGLWVEDLYANIYQFFAALNTTISEDFLWALDIST